jgi:hypothetical protein
MTSTEVDKRLSEELGLGWKEEEFFLIRSVNIVRPHNSTQVEDSLNSGEIIEVWAVTGTGNNQEIFVAYDPQRDDFVIAEPAPLGLPYILGRHPSLREAVAYT